MQPPSAPPEPTDEQQLASLLADLQRYGTLSVDDLRREQSAVTQMLARQRTDYNRVRLAVLYTLAKTSPDDQRALIEQAYFLGLTQTELAERHQLPLGTVKTRIRTGMLALRQCLAQEQ